MLESGARGGGGDAWGGDGGTQKARWLVCCWLVALVRVQLFTQSFRKPTLGSVTSRYKAGGSGGQRNSLSHPCPCVAWDNWSPRLQQVRSLCRPVTSEAGQAGFWAPSMHWWITGARRWLGTDSSRPFAMCAAAPVPPGMSSLAFHPYLPSPATPGPGP